MCKRTQRMLLIIRLFLDTTQRQREDTKGRNTIIAVFIILNSLHIHKENIQHDFHIAEYLEYHSHLLRLL